MKTLRFPPEKLATTFTYWRCRYGAVTAGSLPRWAPHATLGSPYRAGLPAWLGNGLFGPCEKPPPRLAVLLPWAPHVPLPCAPVAAHQPRLTRPSLSLFQLSRHNKSLQQLLKPVKRIQEEEEEGISSMVRRDLGNGGKAPPSHPDPDRRLQRVSHPWWTTLGFAV